MKIKPGNMQKLLAENIISKHANIGRNAYTPMTMQESNYYQSLIDQAYQTTKHRINDSLRYL